MQQPVLVVVDINEHMHVLVVHRLRHLHIAVAVPVNARGVKCFVFEKRLPVQSLKCDAIEGCGLHVVKVARSNTAFDGATEFGAVVGGEGKT
jgi:hypothetical protein